jgi:hypothetical protein
MSGTQVQNVNDVKEILNGFGGVYYGLIEGFTR